MEIGGQGTFVRKIWLIASVARFIDADVDEAATGGGQDESGCGFCRRRAWCIWGRFLRKLLDQIADVVFGGVGFDLPSICTRVRRCLVRLAWLVYNVRFSLKGTRPVFVSNSQKSTWFMCLVEQALCMYVDSPQLRGEVNNLETPQAECRKGKAQPGDW